MKKDNTKPKKAKHYRMPTKLWRFLKSIYPNRPKEKDLGGRE